MLFVGNSIYEVNKAHQHTLVNNENKFVAKSILIISVFSNWLICLNYFLVLIDGILNTTKYLILHALGFWFPTRNPVTPSETSFKCLLNVACPIQFLKLIVKSEKKERTKMRLKKFHFKKRSIIIFQLFEKIKLLFS